MLLRLQRIKHSWGYGLTWPKSGDSRYIIMTPADQGSLTLQRFSALRYLCGLCPGTPTLGFSGQISNWEDWDMEIQSVLYSTIEKF